MEKFKLEQQKNSEYSTQLLKLKSKIRDKAFQLDDAQIKSTKLQELLDSRQARIDQVLKEKQEVVNKAVILKREVKGLEQKYKRVVKEAEEDKEDHMVKFENLKKKSELVEKRFAMQHEDTRSRLHQYFSEISSLNSKITTLTTLTNMQQEDILSHSLIITSKNTQISLKNAEITSKDLELATSHSETKSTTYLTLEYKNEFERTQLLYNNLVRINKMSKKSSLLEAPKNAKAQISKLKRILDSKVKEIQKMKGVIQRFRKENKEKDSTSSVGQKKRRSLNKAHTIVESSFSPKGKRIGRSLEKKDLKGPSEKSLIALSSPEFVRQLSIGKNQGDKSLMMDKSASITIANDKREGESQSSKKESVSDTKNNEDDISITSKLINLERIESSRYQQSDFSSRVASVSKFKTPTIKKNNIGIQTETLKNLNPNPNSSPKSPKSVKTPPKSPKKPQSQPSSKPNSDTSPRPQPLKPPLQPPKLLNPVPSSSTSHLFHSFSKPPAEEAPGCASIQPPEAQPVLKPRGVDATIQTIQIRTCNKSMMVNLTEASTQPVIDLKSGRNEVGRKKTSLFKKFSVPLKGDFSNPTVSIKDLANSPKEDLENKERTNFPLLSSMIKARNEGNLFERIRDEQIRKSMGDVDGIESTNFNQFHERNIEELTNPRYSNPKAFKGTSSVYRDRYEDKNQGYSLKNSLNNSRKITIDDTEGISSVKRKVGEKIRGSVLIKPSQARKRSVQETYSRTSKNKVINESAKESNQDLSSFFTPRYNHKMPNTGRVPYKLNKKHEWNEENLLNKYDAVRLSSNDLKRDELMIDSKILAQKQLSNFNLSTIVPFHKTTLSSSSRNSQESRLQSNVQPSITQAKFTLKKNVDPVFQKIKNKPSLNTAKLPSGFGTKKKNGSKRDKMKSMIRAACSRFT
ncbi:unnamed protein product [Moneuplotes crassus]|uniref:Uncharacterized protein n=1 Tax=Euplotes crassus TaxID=5936 RepID=A0AAD1YAE4_EUPCR|nr:unnamed protein product [Moneuplotes crassus]